MLASTTVLRISNEIAVAKVRYIRTDDANSDWSLENNIQYPRTRG